MKLVPTATHEKIGTLLRNQADLVYGPERTQELTSQIEHLSRMLAEVARREIDLTGAPPDTRGIPERGQQ